ncbi:undecaprenyldiphospho-muramoylpentapeptide beta-N-acetylglucosaminyltransferase [Paraglaciecola sp. L1A13]|uniref:undecaprenyldiphospho-muramoylpentapeptide beta-N-acetylglucosaminyltransferase n=1 Tax=Paraglaciecola sp. L1A13 TaxID=2686359 RepID=UPI00131B135C|nr:undecaprenyldiphospho-muramoylpentapeptide beta-N-acetylglucosaminyltransferase [Paraglaciecola sp. L1A13]
MSDSAMSKTLLVMAGGTGGHVFPGLAVAQALKEQNWHIHWLGTAERMEADLVPKAGFEISFIDIAGVRGNGLLRLLAAPFKIIKAVLQARRVIKQVNPDVVIGMGGFASGPGGVAAWLMGKPLVLHEQNAVPGMTNKLLSRIASKVLTGFDATFEAQKGIRQPANQEGSQQEKYQWVGNPVRAGFVEIKRSGSVEQAMIYEPQQVLNILILGGSLGAKALNENVPLALAKQTNINVRHQCGKGHFVSVTDLYQSQLGQSVNWTVDEFVDDMPKAYQWADLVICRAGALTVAEVAASGVAAIFVPLPHAVDDHQTKNAQTLVEKGAAYLLPQTELVNGGLTPLLKACLAKPNMLIDVGLKARSLAKLDAVQRVTHCCQLLAEKAQ